MVYCTVFFDMIQCTINEPLQKHTQIDKFFES